MEQELIDVLKNMQLTEDEELQISISEEGRAQEIEECSQSLMGKLLTDREQNLRALKNTLRTAWKIGQDLKIVEVVNDILQFKFANEYQLRWERGMTTRNISFTHSPFLGTNLGLPFDMMTEKVGKEIGSNLGNFMAVDTRSWMSKQAKFMRIRVNIPLEKPLRRCGKIASPEGESFCIQFRYERLPIFCFRCGVMGHDERHCKKSGQPNQAMQYGKWLRAQGGSKARLTKEEQRSPLNKQVEDSAMQERILVGVEDGGYSTSLGSAHSGENLGNEKRGSQVSIMSVECEHATQEEVTSPVKMDFGLSIEKENNDEEHKAQKKKGNLKKLARGQNKENEMGKDAASSTVGVKRTLWADEEVADAGRQKNFCGSNSILFDISAVSAEQHRREP
ncbi:hypothetical protein SO802_003006 [Lithocarpus litseifolius]|uniref:CCHC-type domain-containing protein n=1 Tax=Lithocarpus litseifolius TaxID=425828 RepID=A0AAW2DYV4_9ROSI